MKISCAQMEATSSHISLVRDEHAVVISHLPYVSFGSELGPLQILTLVVGTYEINLTQLRNVSNR